MEVPPLVVLYGILLVVGVASLLYVFQVYDSAVEKINEASCEELRLLVTAAVHSAYYQPGNYTATIKTTQPLIILRGNLTVGRDTAKPATCRIDLPSFPDAAVEVLDGTGKDIVVKKTASLTRQCASDARLPALRYVRLTTSSDSRIFISRLCKAGQYTEDIYILVYLR